MSGRGGPKSSGSKKDVKDAPSTKAKKAVGLGKAASYDGISNIGSCEGIGATESINSSRSGSCNRSLERQLTPAPDATMPADATTLKLTNRVSFYMIAWIMLSKALIYLGSSSWLSILYKGLDFTSN